VTSISSHEKPPQSALPEALAEPVSVKFYRSLNEPRSSNELPMLRVADVEIVPQLMVVALAVADAINATTASAQRIL